MDPCGAAKQASAISQLQNADVTSNGIAPGALCLRPKRAAGSSGACCLSRAAVPGLGLACASTLGLTGRTGPGRVLGAPSERLLLCLPCCASCKAVRRHRSCSQRFEVFLSRRGLLCQHRVEERPTAPKGLLADPPHQLIIVVRLYRAAGSDVHRN